MKSKVVLCLVLILVLLGSCSNRKDVVPTEYPSIDKSKSFICSISDGSAFKFKEYRHSDIVLGLEVPQDTIEIKYIDDYYNDRLGLCFEVQACESGVLITYANDWFDIDIRETAYRSRCYEDGEFVYSENDNGYIPELLGSYSDVKDSRSVFYFNNKLETPGELNNNAKPYFITPWCKEEQDEYMDVWKDNIYDTYDTESALPASFYPLDGVCAYQYGVAIFYEDDYCVRAIAYKDSDEARAVVDEFCEFYGVPTPAEYYKE